MKLGELIDQLERRPMSQSVFFNFARVFPTKLDSWRGNYADLAIGYAAHGPGCIEVPTVADFLSQCRGAIGRMFEGYKGGHYRMGIQTSVWIDNWGDYSEWCLVGVGGDDYTTILMGAAA